MALYALGDLHLAFQRPDKSMDAMGPVWVHHEDKIWKNCCRLVKPDDTLVLLAAVPERSGVHCCPARPEGFASGQP